MRLKLDKLEEKMSSLCTITKRLSIKRLWTQFFSVTILSLMFTAITANNSAASNEWEVNKNLPNLGFKKGTLNTEFGPIEVTYQETGDAALYDGDIRVHREQLEPRPNFSNVPDLPQHAIYHDSFRWPNSTLYYRFDDVEDIVKTNVRQAAAHITELTNVNVVELAETATSPYHIKVIDDSGCYSWIGNIQVALPAGTENQELSSAPNCGFGASVHEFLHALGAFHEQAREDRDDYVTIITDNIIPQALPNFDKQVSQASDVGQYDYDSIMHYGPTVFSSNGEPTMIPLVPGATFGQRSGLSAGDISGINSQYSPALKPDLNIETSPLSNQILFPSQEFDITVTISNDGQLSTVNSAVLNYYISTDPTINEEDEELFSKIVSSLDAYDSRQYTDTLTATLIEGTFWVGACVETGLGETNISDNCTDGSLVIIENPTVPIEGSTVYEDAQDGMTDGWDVYDNTPAGAIVRNVFDSISNSQVIEISGSSTANGYRFGYNNSTNIKAWKNIDQTIIQWDARFINEHHAYFIAVETSLGFRYMAYNLANTNQGLNSSGKYVRFGLGRDKKNGAWHTITRDLRADLKKFEPNNDILEVNGMLVRGSGFLDNIMMLDSLPSAIYENAEDGQTDGWDVYDQTPLGASISNIYDEIIDSQVIKLNGSSTGNGYRLGFNNSTNIRAWKNTTLSTIQWDARFINEHHSYFIAVETEQGFRYMAYNLSSSDQGLHPSGKYVRFGLGRDKKNGEWHKITRDLNADLKQFEPSNQILEVNGMLIRGSGFIDNVQLVPTQTAANPSLVD